MTNEEALKKIQDSYNNCHGGKWVGARCFDLHMLEGYAENALALAKEYKWKDCLRWAKRCVEMEKKVGFENTPLWGEFYDTINSIMESLYGSNAA